MKKFRTVSYLRGALPASKIMAAGVGALLVAVGARGFAASSMYLYGDAEATAPASIGSAAGGGPAAKGVAALEAVDARFNDPSARIRAGLLQYRLSYTLRKGGLPDQSRLVQAASDLGEGLARAPADARAWTTLAQCRFVLGDIPGGRLALRTALWLGPNDSSLLLWRSQIGLAVWALLDDEERELVSTQIRLAWQREPDDLVAVAKSRGMSAIIASTLSVDPEQKSAFEAALVH